MKTWMWNNYLWHYKGAVNRELRNTKKLMKETRIKKQIFKSFAGKVNYLINRYANFCKDFLNSFQKKTHTAFLI